MSPFQNLSALRAGHWHQLCEALERLYTPTPAEQLPVHVFKIVTSLIPDSLMSFEEIDRRSGTHAATLNFKLGSDPDWLATLAENLARDHPGIRLVAQGVPLDFWRLSDLISMRQLRQTGMYADQWKPLGVKYQLSALMQRSGRIVGISLNRGVDFSPVEEQLLQTLLPHLTRAHANARLFTALQAASAKTPTFTPSALLRHGITPREAEVLEWIIEGKRNPEIAIILAMSVRTVEKHCQNLFTKLGVETRIAAINRAHDILQKACRSLFPG